MLRGFTIQSESRRRYARFNAEGRQLRVRFEPPTPTATGSGDEDNNPAEYFASSVDELFEYALSDLNAGDMVGISIHNEDNHNDRPIGLSFRRRDQISREVLWSVFERVTQSNARFNALDTLTFTVDSVKMPVGFGKVALKTRGRPLSVMAHLKRSIVKVVTKDNCLAHALI